ncbi:MAG: glycosyltransferase [Acidimicrobiales bacterium]
MIATSIVIPAYNEASRLHDGFARLSPVLDQLGRDETEVIIVDDGSSDATMDVARELYGTLASALFLRQPENRGKGAAVRLGVSVASAQYVIAADADMSINPKHFPDLVAALADADMVPGSRVDEGHIQYESKVRTIAGKGFSRLARHYSGTTLRDTQCGCKGYRRGPARMLALLGMVDGFAFDVELLFLATQLGLRVTPINVTWDDVPGSSVNLNRHVLGMLGDLRSIKHTRYVNPVVELAPDVDVTAIDTLARQTRMRGLVVARGAENALLVLPRDGAVAGHTIAQSLAGTLRTATLSELAKRTYDAV